MGMIEEKVIQDMLLKCMTSLQREKISEEFADYEEVLKAGFGFLGFQVVFDGENCLDFYNDLGDLVFHKVFDSYEDFGVLDRYRVEFFDEVHNKVVYFVYGNRHVFCLLNKFSFSKIVIEKPMNKEPMGMEISIDDSSSSIHLFAVNDDFLVVDNSCFVRNGAYIYKSFEEMMSSRDVLKSLNALNFKFYGLKDFVFEHFEVCQSALKNNSQLKRKRK